MKANSLILPIHKSFIIRLFDSTVLLYSPKTKTLHFLMGFTMHGKKQQYLPM